MRKSLAFVAVFAVSVAAGGSAWAQTTPAGKPQANCANSNALGVARTVEIDTTGAPGFGFEHFKAYDFLRDKEVVLTFDDGPWPHNTEAVLKALADQCAKAMFFPIGRHAGFHPEILKKVDAAGHTIGSHTWGHADLSSKKHAADGKDEIEKGISAVSIALGKPVAPFFRFPALRHPDEMKKYLAERNVAMFSTDIDSFDFKQRRGEKGGEKVVETVMKKLEKRGKGIVLMHDFQGSTAAAVPELLAQLKAGGYKIVHVTGKAPVKSLSQYDEIVKKEIGGGMENARPMSSVIRDVTNQ